MDILKQRSTLRSREDRAYPTENLGEAAELGLKLDLGDILTVEKAPEAQARSFSVV
jgi:hypothetical protein